MNKEFIPYQQALELKELGFDEPCFGYYENQSKKLVINFNNLPPTPEQQKRPSLYQITNRNSTLPQWAVSAPLYQQAFRWFREKYSLHAEITWSPSYEYEPGEWADAIYEITITNVSYTKEWVAESPSMQRANGKQLTYEEAELACLIELFKIVKHEKETDRS